MAEIRLQNLRKEFKDTVAVQDVTITFRSSAVTCLLGPSGCGKTTMMRMIAGLEQPTSGDVYFDEDKVTRVVTRRRRIGMVFQYPVVYSGATVRENIELPLLHEQVSAEERAHRVAEVVEILRLGDAIDVNVDHLDMAARQKVAVAREIARQPRFILFDEPITNVDVETKIQIRRALKMLTRQRKQTIIYVTHDQTDAMTLADEIVLMKEGRIVQCDAPRALYDRPAEVFGGWFLGNPGMNFFEHDLVASGEAAHLVSPLFPRPLRAAGRSAGERVVVGIRPEHVEVREERTAQAVCAKVSRKTLGVGGQYLLAAQVEGRSLKVKVPPDVGARVGAEVWLECPLTWVRLFGADGRRLEVELAEVPL
jgi:ABC-type sugar transport system ATPase subunit